MIHICSEDYDGLPIFSLPSYLNNRSAAFDIAMLSGASIPPFGLMTHSYLRT